MRYLNTNDPLRPHIVAAFRRAVDNPKAIVQGIQVDSDDNEYMARVTAYHPDGQGGNRKKKYDHIGWLKVKRRDVVGSESAL